MGAEFFLFDLQLLVSFIQNFHYFFLVVCFLFGVLLGYSGETNGRDSNLPKARFTGKKSEAPERTCLELS